MKKGTGKPPRNPFEYGRELDRTELVDRVPELAQIATTIRNRGKLFLIGPRRYGKTSLLAAAAAEAEQSGGVVLRFDAEKYESLALLAEAMLTAAVRALRGPVERTMRAVAEAAAGLRPHITLDAQGNLTVGLSAADRDDLPLLGEALDAIEALAGGSRREVVVMLDEIQQIVIEHGEAAERQLRSTVQRHRHVSYVFSGSAVRLLSAMTGDANRPFYRLGARLYLAEIPRHEFRAFLASGLSAYPTRPEGIEAILDLAEDVPYNVQRLAHEVWEMMRTREIEELAADQVRRVLGRIVSREDVAYTQLWTQLTRNQKIALKAVLAKDGEQLQSAEASVDAGLSTSSMQSALRGLEAAHVIRRAAGSGRVRYCLVDPFLGAWLRAAQS